MPNYEQGTLGKLVVQDWDIVSGYPDAPLLYILTPQQAAALVPLVPPLKWHTRWENAPDKDTRDAFVAETMFNLMNPITCAMLNACLADAFAAQTAEIIAQITNINNFGTTTPGLPLTETELTENIVGTTNPTCDQDILWAQCLALIQYTDLAITTLFEQIEAASNSAELLELLDSVPFLNFITTQIGVSGAGAVANYFQEAVAEGYLAQYTPEVEETLACGLFCLFRDDCIVTLDSVIDYFNSRAIALVPDEPSDLLELIEIVAGLDFDGTEVVDIMFWFAWQGMKLAQFVISSASSVSQFEKLLQLAVNDANNDWALLCDCPEEWTRAVDLTAFNGGLDILDSFGTWVDGVGWVGDCENDGNFYLAVVAQIEFAAPATITGAQVTYTVAGYEGDPTADRVWLTDDTVPNWAATRSGANGTDIELGYEDDSDIVDVVGFTVHAGNVSGTCPTGSVVATRFEVSGFGDVPPELEANGWS